ncbi:hypothetical protein GALLN_00925 [Gallionellaceae bacterium]|nr:hypothetical protein GALLN_00925 [Gallionellaceae bacterium]
MLTDEALETIFDHQNTPEEGRKRIRWIRANSPIRRTEGGKRSVKVRFVSRKMGFVLEAEASGTEYAALRTYDNDEETLEIYTQPTTLTISYRNTAGRKITCQITPDLFLIRHDGFCLVECKREEELEKLAIRDPERFHKDPEGKWRSPPAEMAAAALGCRFAIRSSAENNWQLLSNLEFLEDYLHHPEVEIAEEARQTILGCLAKDRWASVQVLVEALGNYGADPLYFMVVRGEVYFNLSAYRLSAPETALVFRDADFAKVYGVFANCTAKASFPTNLGLQLRPGTLFDWDSCQWEILNVGEKRLTARQLGGSNDGMPFIELDAMQLQAMAESGALTAISPTERVSQNQAEAKELLRSCSLDKLDIATYRYSVLFEGRSNDASVRTIKYWLAQYRAAEIQYGNGLLGLVPNLHQTQGNRSFRFPPEVIEKIEQIVETDWGAAHQKSITACYGKLLLYCRELGLEAPSVKTFKKKLKRLSSANLMLRRLGSRRVYGEEVPYVWLEYTTPRHGDRPFHIGHIDHTPIDLIVLDRTYQGVQKTIWLTVLVDAYSRVILGWYLTFDPPSYRSCMMVIRDCVRRNQRIPQFIITDQGSDFRSSYFEILLALLKCHKKDRPAGRPHFGSLIERLFKTTQEQFIHNLRGNKKAHIHFRQVSPSVDPVRHAIWTFEQLNVWIEDYINDVYHKNYHSTLGMSPLEAFNDGLAKAGLRAHQIIPFDRDFIVITCPSTAKGVAKVTPQGVKINYLYFSCDAIADRRLFGEKVPVRYDPFNMGRAYVFVGGQWHEAYSRDFALFSGYSEKALRLATLQFRLEARRRNEHGRTNAARLAEFLISAEEQVELNRQRLSDSESEAVRNRLSILPETKALPNPNYSTIVANMKVVNKPIFVPKLLGDF